MPNYIGVEHGMLPFEPVGRGGLILIDSEGCVGRHATTERMAWATCEGEQWPSFTCVRAALVGGCSLVSQRGRYMWFHQPAVRRPS